MPCLEIKAQDLLYTNMNKQITKRIFVFMSILQLAGCGIETYILNDGITEVPVNTYVFANKKKVDTFFLRFIDTEVIYEEFDVSNNILRRLDNKIETSIYTAYRFYQNGNLNVFALSRNNSIDKNSLNPEYSGYRGVYYTEDGQVRFDYFAADEQLRKHTYRISGEFTFKGDTLFVQRDHSKGISKIHFPQRVYLKRELPPGYLNYNADW